MKKTVPHQQTWNDLGEWWDQNIGDEGDEFHCRLIHPSVFEFLTDVKRGPLLDAGCGNGALSRKLSLRGFEVLGIDVSLSLLKAAKTRTDAAIHPRVHYEHVDLTSTAQLGTLAKNHFHAIVCSMVMHDIPQINPLIDMAARCLVDQGVFVFAIPHPCFNSPHAKHEGNGIRITNYIEPCHERMRSKVGQPMLQDAYHRPISVIFSSLFDAGFFIDGFCEPSYATCPGDELEKGYWSKYPKVPPALIVRCVKSKNRS